MITWPHADSAAPDMMGLMVRVHATLPLQVHMVLQRVAFLMLFENKTMDEMFNTYVSDRPGGGKAETQMVHLQIHL